MVDDTPDPPRPELERPTEEGEGRTLGSASGPERPQEGDSSASRATPSEPARPPEEGASSTGGPRWSFFELARWASRALLVSILLAYVVGFAQSNWGMLTDPGLQNDDARTILFPFHAYGSAGTLGDDPIANEMLSAVPWGVRLLYLVFTPIVDVYVASKLVQLVAFGILAWAAVVLIRSRRTGLAAAAILVFFFLHTPFAVDRIAGGLPRAFGFPCFALWLSGVLAHNRVARFTAPVILALSYPSVMNMILAAEGLLAVRGAFRLPWSLIGRRLKRYAMLVGVCLVCVLPAAVGSSDRGPIHTLEQAEKEPAFGRRGRLWLLPFADPVKSVTDAFVDPATPRVKPESEFHRAIHEEREMVALLVVTFFLLLPLLRLGSAPSVAVAFFAGAGIIYALSRFFAFALYSPERYYSFGMRMACLALFVASSAHLLFWLSPRYRESVRNVLTASIIGAAWLLLGNGFVKDTGMIINRRTDRPLYEFVRTLPDDARFATHILDGDGIPFWGARAHTGSFETLQPWFTGSWARQKKRTLATLEALYATDEQAVLSFAEEYDVTHFLVNKSRYGRSVRAKAGSFEPFTSAARKMLQGKKHRRLVFDKPPQSAIIFEHSRFRVISVEKLRSAWKKGG